jgi:hypothetical protein
MVRELHLRAGLLALPANEERPKYPDEHQEMLDAYENAAG